MQVVCTWFEEDEATGILKLGLVHPDRYSSRCCIGDVDLDLVRLPVRRPVETAGAVDCARASASIGPGGSQEQRCRWRWWREEEGEGRVGGRGLGPRLL